MCLFGARGVEENRIVFLINIFVKNNLAEYPVRLKLRPGLVEVENCDTGIGFEASADLFDDETLAQFLRREIGVQDLRLTVEKKISS